VKDHHRGGRGGPRGEGRGGPGGPGGGRPGGRGGGGPGGRGGSGPGDRGGGRPGGRGGGGGRRSGGARAVWPPEHRETALEAIEQLLREGGLARGFEPAVERAARSARERPSVAVGAATRRDLRELATFTIDPVAARDFDDAVSAERTVDGGVRVWVHIADVSAYVREGGPVDVEAKERATSVYVPGAVEPMLPQALSNDACSLLPGHDRAAVTVELELHGAQVRHTAFYRSAIRSDERLDYDRVDAIFAGREPAREPWGEPLAAAREASAALGRARLSQGGALTLESEEPELVFDEHGEVSEIRGRVQTESHRLIEHLMIAANEAVAAELARKQVPCLYRVHERPRAASVERLVEQLASLGVATPALAAQMSPVQAAKLVGECSRLVEAHVRRTIARARGGEQAVSPTGGRRALTALVLRSLQQAYYSPRNLGHAGLGAACYCHFTSPIRRYPDLVCHRALLSTLGGDERAPRAEALAELGEWTSQRERQAMELERDGDDVARCFALERQLLEQGWERTFPGEIVGLIGAGAFVAFGRSVEEERREGGYRYEGMLPVRRLARAMANESGREWWELNEQGTILRGERSGMALRLGDPIVVRVGRVDPRRGRVDLDLAPPDETGARANRPPKPGANRPPEPGANRPPKPGANRPPEPGANRPPKPGANRPPEPGANRPPNRPPKRYSRGR
jgi:ribonuclease R